MPVRHEYVLRLVDAAPAGPVPAGRVARAISPNDRVALAELMLDAYRGTIDDEGEQMADALAEVDRYVVGADGNAPLLEASVVLLHGQALECACLLKHWQKRDCPLVGYIVTASRCKRRGLAAVVLGRAIDGLRRAGHSELRAVITQGNLASEALFLRAGFRR